jgi:hypothetical protein
MVRHEDAIKAGLFVRLCKGTYVIAVDHRPVRIGRVNFRLLLAQDDADEIDAHAGSVPHIVRRLARHCAPP